MYLLQGMGKKVFSGVGRIILAAERNQKAMYSLCNEHTCRNFSCTQQFHICNFMDTMLSNLLRKITPFQHTMKYKHLLQFPMASRNKIDGWLLGI